MPTSSSSSDAADPPRAPGTLSTMAGSALAGVLARCGAHPLDTVKARLQAQHLQVAGVRSELAALVEREGVRGLYRGFGAVTIGGAPATCLYLTSYDYFKRDREETAVTHLSAGMAAEAIACVLFVPVDIVKERLQVSVALGCCVLRGRLSRSRRVPDPPLTPQLQVQSHAAPAASAAGPGYRYSGSLDALRTIVRVEGVRSIYRGYGATLLSFGPMSALYFAFYERFKAAADVQPGSFGGTLACACAAGSAASWITSPLDLAKMRMQVQRQQAASASGGAAAAAAAAGEAPYRNMFDGVAKAYRAGGLRGLWRGAGARVLFHAPNQALTMAVFEACRDRVASATGDYR